MSDALARVAELVSEQGGLLADAVVPPPVGDPPAHGPLAAAGPRAAAHAAEYELIVELIREGYLLHHERGRVVAPAEADLALLAGDQLYALGLARLAELGDLAATAALADVISLTSQARIRGQGDLAEAVWEAGAAEVGWGASPALDAAKAAARAGEPDAEQALRSAARQLREDSAPSR